MKVLIPTVITDAMLVSSTVAEPDTGETAWNGATAYAVGDQVIRTTLHRAYQRLVAGTTANTPEVDTENWAYIGGTNRWAMFDDTSAVTEEDTELEVVLDTGLINALALVGLQGSTVSLSVTDGAGGPEVYSATQSIDTAKVVDWYAYFFEPYSTRQVVLFSGIPPYAAARATVTVAGTGTVSVRHLVVGVLQDLGMTVAGASAGIRDYSRKTTSEVTGITMLDRRRYAQRMRLRFALPRGEVNAVHQRFTGLRSTPVLWIGDGTGGLEPLTVYGYFTDFSLDLAMGGTSYYSLDIEGMT